MKRIIIASAIAAAAAPAAAQGWNWGPPLGAMAGAVPAADGRPAADRVPVEVSVRAAGGRFVEVVCTPAGDGRPGAFTVDVSIFRVHRSGRVIQLYYMAGAEAPCRTDQTEANFVSLELVDELRPAVFAGTDDPGVEIVRTTLKGFE